jgi:hypothetical protein
MRGWIAGMVACAAVAAMPAEAQRRCSSMDEVSAFEIQALRSEMVVLATGCGEQDRYNRVLTKFQAELRANEQAVAAYFRKTYGRSAQAEYDRFITDMANARSTAGMRLGSDFCPRNGAVFAEMLALRSGADLAAYAAGKDLVSASADVCRDVAAPAQARPPAAAKK